MRSAPIQGRLDAVHGIARGRCLHPVERPGKVDGSGPRGPQEFEHFAELHPKLVRRGGIDLQRSECRAVGTGNTDGRGSPDAQRFDGLGDDPVVGGRYVDLFRGQPRLVQYPYPIVKPFDRLVAVLFQPLPLSFLLCVRVGGPLHSFP
jgi:hypothetical protein